MDRLRCIQTFIEVARAKSFTAAARRIGVSKASVTKQVAAVETLLGVQLLTRSTQHVGLTDAGAALMQAGGHLLEKFQEAETLVKNVAVAPKGLIRVGVPPSFGAYHLVPAVTAYAAANPDVQFSVWLDDGSADLVRDGLDMSIRIAVSLRNSRLISKLLTQVPQVLVAAPAYLERMGAPRSPRELEGHDCLIHVLKSQTGIWRLKGATGLERVRVSGTLNSNFGDVLRSAALRGCGISMHPIYMVHEDLQAGRLVRVLPEFEPDELKIYVVYPQRRFVPVRLREFLGFLKDWFNSDRQWLGPQERRPGRAAARMATGPG